ncbi:MAG: hypothetical protein ACUVXA_15290 [Candidatus Jordarchaeum sp.]|uniref:hypothetical protein n=1 Tax=Candidatus Jordarchaeum sp. TaxID=2823881 RepID=UPI00404B5AC4
MRRETREDLRRARSSSSRSVGKPCKKSREKRGVHHIGSNQKTSLAQNQEEGKGGNHELGDGEGERKTLLPRHPYGYFSLSFYFEFLKGLAVGDKTESLHS